jgi:osmotically-inducible protein OsmY
MLWTIEKAHSIGLVRAASDTVANAAQKKKAEEVARGIEGTKDVRSQVTISATDGK